MSLLKEYLKELYIDLLNEERQLNLKNDIPNDIREAYENTIITPEFQSWYVGSKLHDVNGKPIVWYHGTTANFKEFSDKFLDRNTLISTNYFGFYFTTSPQTASIYVAKKFDPKAGFKKEAKIKAYFLNVKNPYYLSQRRYWQWGNLKGTEAVDLLTVLKSKGFDGLIMESVWRGAVNNSYDVCVFGSDQIMQIAEKRL